MQADVVSKVVVDNVRRVEGVRFGEHGDTFFVRAARLPVVIGLLRQELSSWLERRGVARADVVDITLASSEAWANAIEHPVAVERQAVEVAATVRRSEVVVSVRDFGQWTSEVSSDGDERGRGLEMIRALMDDVAVVAGGRGTQLTMRRRLGSRRVA